MTKIESPEAQALERIRLRCTECGDCWLWGGAVSRSRSGRRPVMIHDGKNQSVRRVVAQLTGMRLGPRLASTRCAQSLCVSPNCLLGLTVQALQQRTSDLTRHQSRPSRNLRQRQSKASKLNMDLAREIRASPLKQKDAAVHFDVSPATISSVRRHKTWKEYDNPFAGLMLMSTNHNVRRMA